jgi:hypothetical protein
MSLGVAPNPGPENQNDDSFSVHPKDMDERIINRALDRALR